MNFLSSIKYFLYVWKDSNLIPLCVCRYLTIYPCYIYSTVDTHKPQNCHQSPHTLLLKESNFNNTATHLLGWGVSWPTDHISILSVILTLDTLTAWHLDTSVLSMAGAGQPWYMPATWPLGHLSSAITKWDTIKYAKNMHWKYADLNIFSAWMF